MCSEVIDVSVFVFLWICVFCEFIGGVDGDFIDVCSGCV